MIMDVKQARWTVWAGSFQKDHFSILWTTECFYGPGYDVSDQRVRQVSATGTCIPGWHGAG